MLLAHLELIWVWQCHCACDRSHFLGPNFSAEWMYHRYWRCVFGTQNDVVVGDNDISNTNQRQQRHQLHHYYLGTCVPRYRASSWEVMFLIGKCVYKSIVSMPRVNLALADLCLCINNSFARMPGSTSWKQKQKNININKTENRLTASQHLMRIHTYTCIPLAVLGY